MRQSNCYPPSVSLSPLTHETEEETKLHCSRWVWWFGRCFRLGGEPAGWVRLVRRLACTTARPGARLVTTEEVWAHAAHTAVICSEWDEIRGVCAPFLDEIPIGLYWSWGAF